METEFSVRNVVDEGRNRKMKNVPNFNETEILSVSKT
jgi:hypothetical protein